MSNFSKYLYPPSEQEISNRLDINNEDKNEILISAIHNGYLKGVKKIINYGANIHENHELALRTASSIGDLNIIQYLLENGANIHMKKEASLKNSIRALNFELTRYLIQHGADVQEAITRSSLFEHQKESLKKIAYDEYKNFISKTFRKIMSKK